PPNQLVKRITSGPQLTPGERVTSLVDWYNKNIESIDQFSNTFSFIDKDIILQNLEGFRSEQIDLNKYEFISTGGTAGRPLNFLAPKNRYVHELSSLHWLWGKIGYEFSPCAVVRNERVENRPFIIDPIKREFIFDGFENDANFYMSVYATMKKYRIPFFIGYTSNAVCLVDLILNNNLDCSFLKGVITTSEKFDEYQGSVFAKLNNVAHMSIYGHSEKVLLGGWCEGAKRYHFYNQYGFSELINEAGAPVEKVGDVGELVGTALYNDGMPMIRYRLGDFAILADRSCPVCGHEGLSVSKIMGRWQGQRIYNDDGTFVTTTALNLHSRHYECIDGLQYYQKQKGELQIRIVPGAGFGTEAENSLLRAIEGKLSKSTNVTVERVPALERQENGKFLLLMSDIE
ncbi:MAG: hypothetical protein VCD66_20220, partial [Alphaproteobacteria bacterium]